MEKIYPNLTITKVPNTFLGFINKFLFAIIAYFAFTTHSFGQIAQRGTATTATSTNTSITIDKPTGVVAGDIMLVNIGSQANNGNLSNPSLAGWNIVQGEALQNNNKRWAAVLYKIATISEPNSYTFNLDDNADNTAGAIVAFSGVDNTAPFDTPTPTYSTQNSNTVIATGLTTSTANSAIIMFGVVNNNPGWSGWSTTNPGTLTELYDVAQANNISTAAAWTIKTSIGSTGNGTANLGGNGNERNGAILVALRRASCHPLTYCTPTFPDGVKPITNISFVSINNSSASNSTLQYEKFCNSTDVNRGNTYQISVTAPSTPYQLGHMYVYFDWNKNGVFTDANEYYYIGNYKQNTNSVINTTLTANIIVPTGASLGLTTMRVGHKLYNGSDSTNLSSCTFWGYGQAEDYLVNVLGNITPTITNFSPNSGCVGSTLTINGTNLLNAISVTIGGTQAAITNNTANSITVTVGNGTTGAISVTTTGGTVNSTSNFTVLTTPTITTQPAAPTTVCAGSGTRTISVSATNGTTYQWRRNGVNITNTAPYSGVTTNTLTITNPALAIAGNFDVVVSNGSCSRTSNAVTLTVSATPTITSNPANSTIASGANTSFTVAASNSPTSYSWQVSTDGGFTWSTVINGGVYTNATSATLNITNASGTMNGYRYRASATNSCGTSAFSNAAILTVTLNYCIPTTTNRDKVYINRIDFVGTLNDVSNASTFSASGYEDFTGLTTKAIQAQGEGVNIILNNVNVNNVNTGGRVKAWIDWNKDGVFSQNATEEIYNPGAYAGANLTFGFIIPPTTQPGLYRIRFRVYNSSSNSFGYDFNPCESFTGNNYSDVEDYLFQVIPSCSANIISVTEGTNCGSGQVVISATGTSNTTSYRWYTSETITTPIAGATGSTYTTPSLTTTTTFYVTAFNGTCESVVKTPVIANIEATPTISITPENPVICGENAVISIVAGGDKETVTLVNEDFESNTLGTFNNLNTDSNNSTVDNKTAWQIKSSSFIPTGGIVWYPAISSGIGNNKFALATSDINPIAGNTIVNSLTLVNSVNTTDFINLKLKLKMFYSRELPNNDTSYDEFVKIQASTDNGLNWTTLQNIVSDIGIGTRFATLEYDLDSYTNNTNLKIRILHSAYSSSSMWLAGGVAVDDIKLFGEKTLSTSFNYNTTVVDAFQDFACTIPYLSGTPATNIFIRPTVTQLENASFIIPVSTTLSNGCIVSGNVNVTNNSKLFTPSATNSDWNTASNWKPNGVPTSSNCVVVYKDVNITGPNHTERGLNLIVKAGKTLNIAPNNSLVITDFVNVEPTGTFQIENNSNLVQINNVVNTGNIVYKRTAANIKGSDYVYWSSPVTNQALNSIYTSPAQGPKYSWNTLLNNGNGANGNISQGNYVNANGAIMATGTGYLVRGSSSFGMAATNINSTFIGKPNNGKITITVYRGNYEGSGYTGANGTLITNIDDNYNLIGNPYPSAFNALKFLNDNKDVINGKVQLWKHGIAPGPNNGSTINNPFYGTYSNNYSASDYVTINNTGTSTPDFSFNIKSGQGFFVEMLDGPQGSDIVTFNNSQRTDESGNPYTNDAFFKNTNQQNINFDDLERHRIWLDIRDSNNITEVTLVGYIEGATMNDDSSYDATANSLTMGIYSMLNNKSFVIQGRSLPFNDNDQVAIGFNVPSNGNYSIGINTVDGLFLGSQDIFLKDELLNVYHDLKSAPYAFTATAGVHNDRFKIVYKSATVLSNQTFNENEIQIAKNNNIINIVSGNEIMDNVKVFDIRGRLIVEKTKINSNTISIDINEIQNQVLIVNIITSEGIKVTKKIL